MPGEQESKHEDGFQVVALIIAIAVIGIPATAQPWQHARRPARSPATLNGKGAVLLHILLRMPRLYSENGRAFVGNWSSNLATKKIFLGFSRAGRMWRT